MTHFARQPQVGPAVIHYGDETATLHKPGCAHVAKKGAHPPQETFVLEFDTNGDDFMEVAPCAVDKQGTMPKCFGRWVCNDPNCEGDR